MLSTMFFSSVIFSLRFLITRKVSFAVLVYSSRISLSLDKIYVGIHAFRKVFSIAKMILIAALIREREK